jgi:hypothetical protein
MVKKLLLSIYRIFELLGKPYLALIFFKERKFPSFKRPNERPVEYALVNGELSAQLLLLAKINRFVT